MLDDFNIGDYVNLGGLKGLITGRGYDDYEIYYGLDYIPRYKPYSKYIEATFEFNSGKLKFYENTIKHLKRHSNETI